MRVSQKNLSCEGPCVCSDTEQSSLKDENIFIILFGGCNSGNKNIQKRKEVTFQIQHPKVTLVVQTGRFCPSFGVRALSSQTEENRSITLFLETEYRVTRFQKSSNKSPSPKGFVVPNLSLL